MPLETIRVLSIEDCAGDARLIDEMLQSATALGWDLPQFELIRVETLAAALACLDEGSVDVVLSDLDLPDSQAGDTIAQLRVHAPRMPIVVLTGREDEVLARHTVRAGAEDYLFKRELSGSLLAHTLLYAIERQRARSELQAAHDDLERRVQERTAELEQANARLRREVAERRKAEEELARQESELQATLYGIGDAVIATDFQGRVTRMNPVAERLTGWAEVEAAGRPLEEAFGLINGRTRRQVQDPVARILHAGGIVALAQHALLVAHDGREIPIAGSGAPIFDPHGEIIGVAMVFRDQTEEHLARRFIETRLALIEYAADHTLGELLTRALDEVGAFVDSPIGFYHFVEPDQRTISLQQWSTRTLEEFCQAEGEGMHYDIEQAGVWVDCVYQKRPVIHNDYAALAHRKGLPEGHVAVIRELVVPVMREDKVVAILGVGNKPADYTQRDVEVVAYLADVTWEIVRRKRVEEALQESVARLKESQAIAHIGSWELDLITDRLTWSDEVYRMFGLGPQEFDATYETFLDIVHPDDRAAVDAAYAGSLRQGCETYEIEHRIVRPKSGEVRVVYEKCRHIRDGSGRIVRSVGMVQDITERKRVERALRVKDNAIAASINAIAMADIEGKLTYVNDAFLQLWGYDDEGEVLGRPAVEFWQFPQQAADIIEALKESGGWMGELVAIRKDGSLVPVQLSASLARDDWGNPDNMMASFVDITERKQAEQQLRHYAAELQRSNQELQQFAHIASHDLQEPLRTIGGFARLLANRYRGRMDEQADEFIDFIMSGVERMQELLQSLLAYSRVGSRGQQPAPTDSQAVLQRALVALRTAIAESGAEITHDPLPTVWVDAVQLAQLLQNLVGNALKFRGAEPPRVHISAKQGEGMWTFSVRDNGIGIDPQEHEHVFEPFRRLHIREEFPGTGMGLAICERIVARHGGRIWVESAPGEGATFYFTLPDGPVETL